MLAQSFRNRGGRSAAPAEECDRERVAEAADGAQPGVRAPAVAPGDLGEPGHDQGDNQDQAGHRSRPQVELGEPRPSPRRPRIVSLRPANRMNRPKPARIASETSPEPRLPPTQLTASTTTPSPSENSGKNHLDRMMAG